MKKSERIKEKIQTIFLKLKYSAKARKLNVTDGMLDVLVNRYNMKEVKDIFVLLSKSSNSSDFKNNIVAYLDSNASTYMTHQFLLGMISGSYSFVSLSFIDTESFDFHNFLENDYQKSLSVLRENFYDYLMNDNQLKNKFLIDSSGNYDYTLDLDRAFCESVFDECVSGKEHTNHDNYYECFSTARNYILKMIGVYGTANIENSMNFILYDVNHKTEETLEERKQKFIQKSNLDQSQIEQINNVELLIQKLKTIPLEGANTLLDRINEIRDNLENHIDELSDIYMEYEILLRNDILNRLYVPIEHYTIIEDFHDLKPQMLHMFLRNPEKFRRNLENEIITDIISKRNDKSNLSDELTEEEKLEFEKRKQAIDPILNPVQVNYSYDSRKFVYSDKNGFKYYHSDTNNQLSTSVYSASYYLKNYSSAWNMGIGFNSEGICSEAIALSSSQYLTTNMGLTNLEYDASQEFSLLSSNYEELVKNDGKSEVILFRRNMDYDTKASYIFLTIDSSQPEKCEEYLRQAKEMADKNGVKLVVYDLYKIKKSYDAYLEKESSLEVENTSGKII